MINIIRTSSDNPDFIRLVKSLDAELAERDGIEHSFYKQFNQIENLKYCIVAYADIVLAGCGALKEYAPETMEIKRMFTSPSSRNKGIGSKILATLEEWARELSYEKCILETGKKQPEAIRLYEKCGYLQIPNYGQYAGVENSICFEKKLYE